MAQNQQQSFSVDGAIQITVQVAPGINRRINSRVRNHHVTMDVREERGGEDSAPTPPEFMAIGLGGCIINMVRILAAEREATLEDLRVTVSGQVDPAKAMGLASENRAGFLDMTAEIAMRSNLIPEDQSRFMAEFSERCVLCDTLAKGTDLGVRFTFLPI